MSHSVPESSNTPASDLVPVGVPFESFDHVLALNAASVRLYVRSLMPGYEGADDLAQEVLLKIWEKREEYVPGTFFKAWAFQIARYLVMNARRKLSRSKMVEMDDDLINQIDQHWLQSDRMGSEQEHEALQHCMEGLSPQDTQLLHARYATDESLETYARRAGTRSGTLKARLFRIREGLRRCMEIRLQDQ